MAELPETLEGGGGCRRDMTVGGAWREQGRERKRGKEEDEGSWKKEETTEVLG
jgi:hypothetical protein